MKAQLKTVEQVLEEGDRRIPHVYQAIAEVQAELAKTGISKSRKNEQQGYKFRGIDEVYAALAPLLSAHKLTIIPRVLDRQVIERTTSRGGVLFYVTVRAEFDFVSALDGTIHTAATFGEAMDSADKATNKAMSAAYKYAAFMTFAIPTEGDNDADATTHQVSPRAEVQSPPPPTPITDDQRDLIQTLAGPAGKTLQEICAGYKVDSLKDLTKFQASKCIARLQALTQVPA